MENENVFDRAMAFAESGKGRRLLNTLNKKESNLTSFELDAVLRTYCEIGLPVEVETLTKRRGVLGNNQYADLAQAVRDNCCSEKYDEFAVSLRRLLSSGMTMNPTKEEC